jgi:hypothetical protein
VRDLLRELRLLADRAGEPETHLQEGDLAVEAVIFGRLSESTGILVSARDLANPEANREHERRKP